LKTFFFTPKITYQEKKVDNSEDSFSSDKREQGYRKIHTYIGRQNETYEIWRIFLQKLENLRNGIGANTKVNACEKPVATDNIAHE
jgi:hypothetical protein